MTGRRLLLVALVTVVLHLPLFARPFYNADEAIYSSVASRLVSGETLYTGAVDHKPPAMYLTYAAVFRVFGRNSIQAVHALCVLWVLATALLVGAIARRRAGEPAGTVAALLYGAYTMASIPKWFIAANTELFVMLPATAGVLLALARPASALACGLAGALVSVGATYKVQGIFALVPVAYAIVCEREAAWPAPYRVVSALPRLGALAAGALAPWALCALWLHRAGALQAARFWAFGYASQYAVSIDLLDALGRLAARGGFFCYTLPWLPIGAAIEARNLRGRDDRDGVALVVWLGAGALAVSLGGRFYQHYFIQLLPPLCALAAPPLVRGWRAATGPARLALAILAGAPPLAFFAFSPWNDWYLSIDPKEPRTYEAVAAHLRAHTSSDARVFVWGNTPEIYLLSDRVPATRFVFTNYHTGKMWGTPANEDDAPAALRERFVVPESWPMLLEDLSRTPPDVIVDAAAGGLHRFRGLAMPTYPPLARVLERYRLGATVEGVPIYVRR